MSSKSILIIDDEPDVREALEEALAFNGFQVVTAESGLAGLEALKKGEKPGLILLDLMMSNLDGETFIERSQDVLSDRRPPVVLISAEGETERKATGLNVAGVLKKPIKLRQLLEVAQRYCG